MTLFDRAEIVLGHSLLVGSVGVLALASLVLLTPGVWHYGALGAALLGF